MANKVSTRNSGAWVERQADAMWVRSAGAWKSVLNTWVRSGSAWIEVNSYLPGNVVISTNGTPSHTAAPIAWSNVARAVSYNVYRGGSYIGNTTGTTYSVPLPSATTNYAITVKAVNASAQLSAAFSNTLTANGGRPEVRKSGNVTHYFNCYGSNSWRPSTGWGYIGSDVAQGYYSSTSNRYWGVMSYDGPGIVAWINATYGADVLPNATFNSTAILMRRDNAAGSSSAQDIGWYVSTAWAGIGGQPDLAGGHTSSGIPRGGASWIAIPGHWGGHIIRRDSGWQSFVIYRGDANGGGAAGYAGYSQYYGPASIGDAGQMQVNFSWNFVTVSYVAPSWV